MVSSLRFRGVKSKVVFLKNGTAPVICFIWVVCFTHDEEIWKFSFTSTVRPTVTNPSRKRSFSKTLLKPNWGIWKRWPCALMWTKNILKTDSFLMTWRSGDFPARVPKWPIAFSNFNFSGVERTENIWCVQSETSVLNSLRRSMDGLLTFFNQALWHIHNKKLWSGEIF